MAAPTPPPPIGPDDPDRVLAILCHVSFFLGIWFILPLIVYLVKRNESAFVGFHAKEVLNFHLSLMLYFICAFPLVFFLIGIPIYIALGLTAFVCAIIGTIRAAEGQYYLYPITIRFI